jgi:hypothetical protein
MLDPLSFVHCLALLFQVLNMPFKFAKFQNFGQILDPFLK